MWHLQDFIGMAIVALPGILLFDKLKDGSQAFIHHEKYPMDVEEDILTDVLTCDKRLCPEFVSSSTYKSLRTERAKTALTELGGIINQNLENGNREFDMHVSDPDKHIVEVVRRLLIQQLNEQGYAVKITLPEPQTLKCEIM